MKKLSLLFIGFLIIIPNLYTDEIVLTTGQVVEGRITRHDDQGVEIKNPSSTVSFNHAEFREIKYNHPPLWFQVDQLFKNRKYEEAVRIINEFLSNKPSDDQFWKWKFKLGISYLHLGQMNQALMIFDPIAKAESSKDWGLKSTFIIADIFLYQGKPELAKIWLNIREKNQTDKTIINAIGDKKRIIEVYDKNLKRFYEISSMKWHYKNLILYDEIISKSEAVIDQCPGTMPAVLSQKLVADCYEKQAEYEKNEFAFKEFLTQMDVFSYRLSTKSILDKIYDCLKKEDTQEALRFCKIYAAVFTQGEHLYQIYFLMGILSLDLKNYDEAADYYRKVLFSAENNKFKSEAFNGLSDVLLLEGKFTEMEKMYKDSFRYVNHGLNPSVIHYKLGILYLSMDREKDALLELKQVKKREDPTTYQLAIQIISKKSS